MAAYREALRLQPDNAGAHGNLGATLDAQGRGEEALVHLREAVRLQPESAQTHGNLGVSFVSYPEPVTSLAWDGGRHLVAADADGLVRTWTLPRATSSGRPMSVNNRRAVSKVTSSPAPNARAEGSRRPMSACWNI